MKQYTIYSTIPPYEAKTVSANERKKYLNCKFWKSSKKEAEIFFYLYFLPPCYWGMEVVVAILSGELFKANSTSHLLKSINEIYEIYKQDPENELVLNHKKYTKLIKVIEADSSYRNFSVIDDIVDWACSKKIINLQTKKLIGLELAKTRVNIFKENVTSDFLKEQIRLLINGGHTCIFYNDLQVLLFPEHDLLAELKEEAESSDRVMANASLNREHIYFEIKTVLKWLMQKGYLSETLTQDFRSIKIESIQENQVIYDGQYDSFSKLIHRDKHYKEDLLHEAMYKRPLYIKYDPYDPDLVKYDQQNYPLTPRETVIQQYKGFGRLKRYRDDTFGKGSFGELSVDMLIFDSNPKHFLSKDNPQFPYQIELVPTEEEARYGLRRYLKINPENLHSILADERLVFLKDVPMFSPEEVIPASVKKLRPSQEDKIKVQATAVILWKQNPNTTIEDMIQHDYIQLIANGRLYKGKNTLRDWLSEVDPRSPEQKTGRPRKSSEK